MEEYIAGFDDYGIKEKYEKSFLEQQNEESEQQDEEQKNKEPEVMRFKEVMSNFFEGIASIDANKSIILNEDVDTIRDEIATEIFQVLDNHREYPDDENLKGIIYTQETENKRMNELKRYGLKLIQKYLIQDYFYNQENDEVYYISPLFSIEDINKLTSFFRKIDMVDKELKHYIDMIVGALHSTIIQNFGENISNEEIDITEKINSLNRELDRIGVWDSLINKDARGCFIALQEGCIKEFIAWKNKGFHINIGDIYVLMPCFFNKIITEKEKNQDINYPSICKSLLEEIDKEVTDKIQILQQIKDKKILIERISLELVSGILEVVSIIKEHKNLEKKDKSIFLKKFDDCLSKIYDLQSQ